MGLFHNHFVHYNNYPKPAAENKPSAVSNDAANMTADTSAVNMPDTPIPFGFKTSWLCVKGFTPEEVIEKLGLKDPTVSSWKNAFANINSGCIVSPMLDNKYVLVIGWGTDIITEDPARLDEVGTLFHEVQYFASHRVVEYAAWVKYKNGRKIRAYGWVGDSGEVLTNFGQPTPEETALGFVNFLPDNDSDFHRYETPDEDTVVQIAAAWGINTLELDKYPESTVFFCKY